MCRLRQVRIIYSCGHGITQPDEMQVCESRWCKFSPYHPITCVECSKTCWQARQFPEQYNPCIMASCPDCATKATGKH